MSSNVAVVLPEPPNLYILLLSQGLDAPHAQQISEKYLEHTISLRNRVEEAIELHAQTFEQLPELLKELPEGFKDQIQPFDLVSFYWKTVHEWVQIATEAAAEYQSQEKEPQHAASSSAVTLDGGHFPFIGDELDIDFDHPEKYGLLPGFNYVCTPPLLISSHFDLLYNRITPITC